MHLQKQNPFKLKSQYIFTMNKFISILLGLVLLVVAIYTWGANWAGFGQAALNFLKGGIIWMVLLIGAVLLFIGFSELKE